MPRHMTKNLSITSLKYPPESHKALLCVVILNVCSNHKMFTLTWTAFLKTLFADYGSDTFVTLKQGQSDQTWYKLADPQNSYNHTKFERSHFHRV